MNFSGYLNILRLHQWLKNFTLFFPPFLGGALLQPGMLSRGIVPFLAFSLVSSATYIFNDIMDLEHDKEHPTKCRRPLASGTIDKSHALILMLALLLCGVLLGGQTSPRFLLFVLLYLLISGLYSLELKHRPIADIFCITVGFVLRLYAGGDAFGVLVSDWLFLTVFLLALFLSVGKRCSESLSLGENAGKHRRALAAYPEGFLEGTMYLVGAAVLVTYSMYVINQPLLVYTVPLCMFGLLRYLFCVKSGKNGDPTQALLKDGPLLSIAIVWVLMVTWGVYR